MPLLHLRDLCCVAYSVHGCHPGATHQNAPLPLLSQPVLFQFTCSSSVLCIEPCSLSCSLTNAELVLCRHKDEGLQEDA